MHTDYGDSDLTRQGSAVSAYHNDESSIGVILPLGATERDIFVGGTTVSFNRFEFENPAIEDRDLYTLYFYGAWARQLNEDWQIAALLAPVLHSDFNGDFSWDTEWLTGVFARQFYSKNLSILYGFVYDYGLDDWWIYPYLGIDWIIGENWSLSLILPWPSVNFAVSDHFVASLGFSPGGGSWAADRSGDELAVSFGSWDLSLGLEYEFYERFWISGSVGWAGFRGFEISNEGKTYAPSDSDNDPFVRIGIQFRP